MLFTDKKYSSYENLEEEKRRNTKIKKYKIHDSALKKGGGAKLSFFFGKWFQKIQKAFFYTRKRPNTVFGRLFYIIFCECFIYFKLYANELM